jgi:hypothetical protein
MLPITRYLIAASSFGRLVEANNLSNALAERAARV